MEKKIDLLYENIGDLPTKDELKFWFKELFSETCEYLKKREDDLKNTFSEREENLVKKFDAEIRKRDTKIEHLEQLLESHITSKNIDIQVPKDDIPIDIPTVDSNQRKHCDTLLIGDSIIKYVNIDTISQGENIHICVPGARADNIWSRIVEISLTHRFDSIVIHCGSNYVPHRTSDFMIHDLIDLLTAVQDLLPNTHLYYSSLLPKLNASFLPGVKRFNRRMKEECIELGVGFITHHRFGLNYEQDRRMICKDGVHLNYSGVATLQRSIVNHFH